TQENRQHLEACVTRAPGESMRPVVDTTACSTFRICKQTKKRRADAYLTGLLHLRINWEREPRTRKPFEVYSSKTLPEERADAFLIDPLHLRINWERELRTKRPFEVYSSKIFLDEKADAFLIGLLHPRII
ncbi:hypothetical protein SK128_021422, partial [Halocaridina rubra]